MAYIRLGQMARASIALTVFVALALSADPAAAAKKKRAAAKPKPQIQVQVSVVNNSPTRARGVFQSTDAGDFGTSCTVEANPSGLPNIGCASKPRTYTNPPKNIKNLLCIFEKFGVQYTPSCQKLMDSVPNCKRNDIFTSLCGTSPGGRLCGERCSGLHLPHRRRPAGAGDMDLDAVRDSPATSIRSRSTAPTTAIPA